MWRDRSISSSAGYKRDSQAGSSRYHHASKRRKSPKIARRADKNSFDHERAFQYFIASQGGKGVSTHITDRQDELMHDGSHFMLKSEEQDLLVQYAYGGHRFGHCDSISYYDSVGDDDYLQYPSASLKKIVRQYRNLQRSDYSSESPIPMGRTNPPEKDSVRSDDDGFISHNSIDLQAHFARVRSLLMKCDTGAQKNKASPDVANISQAIQDSEIFSCALSPPQPQKSRFRDAACGPDASHEQEEANSDLVPTCEVNMQVDADLEECINRRDLYNAESRRLLSSLLNYGALSSQNDGVSTRLSAVSDPFIDMTRVKLMPANQSISDVSVSLTHSILDLPSSVISKHDGVTVSETAMAGINRAHDLWVKGSGYVSKF